MADNPKPTLKQVATQAEVSVSAASMILNSKSGFSFAQETIQKVLDAADSLGYPRKQPTPQDMPDNSKSISLPTILVLCPNVTNPYYATIVQTIEQSASQQGYTTLVHNTYRDPLAESRIIAAARSLGILGVIFASMPANPDEAERLNATIPTVVIGDRNSSINIDTVETSNLIAGVLIGEHLLSLGHRHVAFISTTLDAINSARTQRLCGLRQAFERLGPEAVIQVCSHDVTPDLERSNILIEYTTGFELCKQIISNKSITAIVATNDMVAYGVIDAILGSGLRIPEDYSVCGFDNNFPSRLSKLSLTTVEHCIEDKGHSAFDILYQKILALQGADSLPNHITRVEYRQHLIKRSSTAAPSR